MLKHGCTAAVDTGCTEGPIRPTTTGTGDIFWSYMRLLAGVVTGLPDHGGTDPKRHAVQP